MGILVIAQTSTGASRNKIKRYLKYCKHLTIKHYEAITNRSVNVEKQ